jgi:hypothetical protein
MTFCSQAVLRRTKQSWSASIDFDTVEFKTGDLPSADQAVTALHAKVAACPYFEKLARPTKNPTRGGLMVPPLRGCDDCSIVNRVATCR